VALRSANVSFGSAPLYTQPLTLAGEVTLTGNNTVALVVPVTITGAVGGTGALLRSGVSDLTLTGEDTHTGAIVVNNGTVTVNGSQPDSFHALFTGTLSGTGTVGYIAAANGAVVNPGNPHGILAAAGANFSNGGVLTIQIAGTAVAGVDYDRLDLGD